MSTADIAILQLLLRYHCASIGQVTRALYAPTSINWVQQKLRRLYEAGYVDRDRIPIRRAEGPSPLYYVLSRAGMLRLADEGEDVPPRARPYRIHGWDYYHVRHLLAVNEVLLAANQLQRTHPQVSVTRWLHDLDLKQRPVPVLDAQGQRRQVVPDGFIDFAVRVGAGWRVPVCLELDRGTEKQADFGRKIALLLRFADGPYQAAFGRGELNICVIATRGREHRDRLLHWTETTLTELGEQGQAGLFQFATFPLDWAVPDAERPAPAELFVAPRWSMPFDRRPAPLLDELDIDATDAQMTL